MNSRERILAAVHFEKTDRIPFDFFEESGYTFLKGKYDPSRRLAMTYSEQVDARIEFHKLFKTDLIFDAPVFIPSEIPCQAKLFYNERELESPCPVYSSVSGMVWNAMPPKVVGAGLLPDHADGHVVKKVTWENGITATEIIDLATGTTDVGSPAFESADEFVDNIACAQADTGKSDYTHLRQLRENVGPDVMLSGTLGDPCSLIGWYTGLQNMMLLLYDDEKKALELCELLTETVVEAGVGMIENGVDMIRLGAATSCLLSPELFQKYCVPFLKTIAGEFRKKGAISQLHMCGNINHLLDLIPDTECEILETITPPPLGDTTLAEAKNTIGKKMCLKGNLCPTGKLKNGTPEEALEDARKCLETGSKGGGFIFSVADNLAKGTPEKNIGIIADYIQNHG